MTLSDIRPVFICETIRTPIGRYGGALSSVRPDDLAAHAIKSVLDQAPKVAAEHIDEVVFGCANQAGEDNRNVARMGALLAGLPVEIPGTTMNRLCGSGMDAVGTAARAIACGEAELIVAGGVESMSRSPFVIAKSETAFSRKAAIEDTTIGWRFINPAMQAMHGTDSMPETGENVAQEFGVSREDQDAFAVRSQAKAAAAIEAGRLAEEIAPIAIPRRKGDPVIVDADEHPRPGTDMAALARLRPLFPNGTVTAGNASGVNDGAAALILASEEAVKTHGLNPVARILTMATAGVPPRIMGMGPAPASEKALARVGLKIGQMGVIELNEAFASQGIQVLRELGVPEDAEHVNPNTKGTPRGTE